MPPFSCPTSDPFIKSVLRAYANAEEGRIRAQSALEAILGKDNLPPEVKNFAQAGLSPKSCPLCLKDGVPISPDGGESAKVSCSSCGLSWIPRYAGQGESAAAPARTTIEDKKAGGEKKEEGGMEEKGKLSQELRKILAEITSGLTKANEIFDGLEAEMKRAAVKLGIDKKKSQEGEERG